MSAKLSVIVRFSDVVMASSTPTRSTFPLDNYELLDRYRRESGRVFLTGTQALARIPPIIK